MAFRKSTQIRESFVRCSKPSNQQKFELLKFFEENPNSLRIVNSNENMKEKQKIWIYLTHRLNSLDGAIKTTSKWARFWSDSIIYIRKRSNFGEDGLMRYPKPNEFCRRLLNLISDMNIQKPVKISKENNKTFKKFETETMLIFPVDNVVKEEVMLENDKYANSLADSHNSLEFDKLNTSYTLTETTSPISQPEAQSPQEDISKNMPRHQKNDIDIEANENESGKAKSNFSLPPKFGAELCNSIRTIAQGFATISEGLNSFALLLEGL